MDTGFGYNRVVENVRATFLGTGDAWPIPRPGCGCDQCAFSREDAKERRTRSGVFLETSAGNSRGQNSRGQTSRGQNVLLDASPDLTHQFEREGIDPVVDRVVISHHHDDHMNGLRDLCYTRRGGPDVLPVHCGPVTRRRIEALWPSLLRPGEEKICFEPWDDGTVIEVGPVTLKGVETNHRDDEPTTAFLIHVERGGPPQRILYATDMGPRGMGKRLIDPDSPVGEQEYVKDVWAILRVDLFVGDGTYLGEGGYGHPGTDRMIEIAREGLAKKIAITHVGHWGVDPDTARQRVPADVAICRDGDDLFSFLD